MESARTGPARSATVRIGPAGWSYDDWKGIVYPQRMARGTDRLTYIASLFNTVEVNSTFYRPPRKEYSAGWLRKVEGRPDFKFTLKLWQRFTHERDTWPSDNERETFTEGIAPIFETGKLGAILVQFPWSFRNVPENRSWLDRIFDAFEKYPLALEIRHASWNVPEVYEHLHERRVAFCNIDQPVFRDSLKPTARVTARVGYVRLHGQNAGDWFRENAGRDQRYNYLYSEDELEPWIEKIDRMSETADEIYVITNNHYRGQAVVNALEMNNKITGTLPDIPAQLLETYPRLRKIAGRPSGGQLTLV